MVDVPRDGRCPICTRPAPKVGLALYAPFCSPRCKDRDLLNWLGEGYAVPGEPVDLDDMMLDKPGAAD